MKISKDWKVFQFKASERYFLLCKSASSGLTPQKNTLAPLFHISGREEVEGGGGERGGQEI